MLSQVATWIEMAERDLSGTRLHSSSHRILTYIRSIPLCTPLIYLIYNDLYFQPIAIEFMRHPREYRTGFRKRLLQAYTRSCDQPPRKDLRRKFALDIRKTDRELFQEYPCNPDQWFDAELPKTFWYLAGSRSLRIPDSWAEAIGDFKKELHQACVPYLLTWWPYDHRSSAWYYLDICTWLCPGPRLITRTWTKVWKLDGAPDANS